MFDDNYNREEVDNIIESVTHHIVGFKEGLEHLGIRQIEENVSPMSLHDFNKLVKIFLSKFDYLVSLVNELKEFRNTSEIFEELNNSLSWFDHETETLLHSPTDTDKIQELIDILEKSIILLNSKILPIRISNQQSQQLIEENLAPKIKEIEEKVKDIERAKLALQNDRIHLIFEEYEEKLKNEADSWEIRFFMTLAIGAILAILIIFCPDMKIGFWNYIFLKVLLISIVITLSTYFLRRSVHLRKQSDELGRMSFEMDALPSFMSSLSNDKSEKVITELIPKYFARPIDQSQNDKIGDLMKDQLAAGTELIKASAEMVKAKDGSKTPP